MHIMRGDPSDLVVASKRLSLTRKAINVLSVQIVSGEKDISSLVYTINKTKVILFQQKCCLKV